MALSDPIPELKDQLRKEILLVLGDCEQFVVAKALGVDQPRVSDLHHGNLERMSLQKLIRMLARIDRRVDLKVTNVGKFFRPRLFHFPERNRNQIDGRSRGRFTGR